MTEIFKILKQEKIKVFFILLLRIFVLVLELMIPLLFVQLIDSVKNGNEVLIKSISINLMMISMISLVVGITDTTLANILTFKIQKKLMNKVFEKILSLSVDKIDKLKIPSILTRITSDVDKLAEVVWIMLVVGLRGPIILLGSFIITFRINPILSLMLFSIIPIVIVIIKITNMVVNPVSKASKQIMDKLNLIIRENIKNIRVVKTYTLEKNEVDKYKAENARYKKVVFKYVIFLNLIFPIIGICINLILGGIYTVGGNLVIENKLTIAELIGFFTYIGQITASVTILGMIVNVWIPAKISKERIEEILNEESSIKEIENPKLEIEKMDIEFKDVTFKYSEDETILDKINLKINKNEKLGILGPTGSGKSTIVKLLTRLYDVTSGEILIDGINIKDYKLSALNNQIAVVEQTTKLLSGTIKENLTMGKDLPDEEIKNALKTAKAYDFVKEYEDFVEHEVLIDGKNFSGGQKQRLSIARAYLKKAKLMIFDDSTSALDYKTEREIEENIQATTTDLTTIIISQRISSIKNCDKIVILEEGKITALRNT